MSSDELFAQATGLRLYNEGWRLGSTFELPAASFSYYDLQKDSPELVQLRNNTETPVQLVLISQECDLVAKDKAEPYVEALVCLQTCDKGFLRNIEGKSHRYFAIDPQNGLIVHASGKVHLSKKVLLVVKPEEWPGNQKHLLIFRRWLAERYARPPLPDTYNEVFTDKVDSFFKQLIKTKISTFVLFDGAVRELRANLPGSETPPYDIDLVLLLKDEPAGLTAEEADAIDEVKKGLREVLGSDHIHLLDIRNSKTDEISLAEYEKSYKISLDYFTYKGENLSGTEPPQ